jgi:hypothetical protein
VQRSATGLSLQPDPSPGLHDHGIHQTATHRRWSIDASTASITRLTILEHEGI